MNWLHYLAEANIYLGVFYLAYCLFLNKETYYTFNRIYLLLSCVLAFILPLVQLGFLKPTVYITAGTTYVPATVDSFIWQDGILYSYITGVIIFAIQFAIKLYQLQKLARLKPAYSNGDYKLVYLEGSNTAFSFFNYLFIGTETAEPELITRHELVHIRQKHSADVILLELLKIINWFNPAIYLLQNSIKTVHEYIADEKTALIETDPTTYSTFLVNNAYGISGPSFTHSFFNYNLLKKRIIMLHQKRSGSLATLKYLIAVPLCAGLLCESTLGFSKTYGFVNIGGHASIIVADTIPNKVPPPPPPVPPVKGKKAPKVIDVVLTPPPPIVRKDNPTRPVKFPPPIVRKDKPNKSVKFPPPIVVPDKAPEAKTVPVKFPPPIKGKIEKTTYVPAKGNKPAVIITDVILDEPAVTKKTTDNEIRIDVPMVKPTGNEIRIDEPVKPEKKP